MSPLWGGVPPLEHSLALVKERSDPRPNKGKPQDEIEHDKEPEGEGAFGSIDLPAVPSGCHPLASRPDNKHEESEATEGQKVRLDCMPNGDHGSTITKFAPSVRHPVPAIGFECLKSLALNNLPLATDLGWSNLENGHYPVPGGQV